MLLAFALATVHTDSRLLDMTDEQVMAELIARRVLTRAHERLWAPVAALANDPARVKRISEQALKLVEGDKLQRALAALQAHKRAPRRMTIRWGADGEPDE